MAEDLISGYVDRAAFESDTRFIVDQLEKAKAHYKEIKDIKVTLSVAGGAEAIKQTASAAQQSLKAMKELNLTTANYHKFLAAISGEVDNFTEAQNKTLRKTLELYKAEEAARAGAKETVKLIQTQVTAEARLEATKSDLAQANAILKMEQMKLNKEMKVAADVATTERNTLDRARALILYYTNAKKSANLATEEGRRLNESYNKAIAKTNEWLLKHADSETQRTKTVGNYGKSAQIVVEALEKERKKLEELIEARNKLQSVQNAGAAKPISGFGRGNAPTSQAGAGAATGINTQASVQQLKVLDEKIETSRKVVEGFRRMTDQPQFLKMAGDIGDANKELRFFTKQLIELERNGMGGSQAAEDLRKHLAQLTDEIADAKSEVKALSSDTRGMDLFAGSVAFAADAMQTAAGAAALFGASEEETAEAIKTVVAIQSISNGVKGIANELTTRGTAANKLYAAAQKTVSTALDSTAKATVRLRAAMMALGWGALVVGIGLLISNFGKVKNAIMGVTKEQEVLNETVKDYASGAQSATETVNKVKVAFAQAERGIVSKEYALKVYNDTLGDAFGKTNDLATAEKNLNDKKDAYIKAMALKAQANALFAKSADFATEAMTAHMEDQTSLWNKMAASAKGTIAQITGGGVVGGNIAANEALAASQVKRVEQRKKEAEKMSKELEDMAAKLLKQSEEAMSGAGIKDADAAAFDEAELKKRADKEKKAAEERLKASIEAEKKRNAALLALAIEEANERIKINQRVVENENESLESRLKAAQNISEERKKIAALELATAVEAEKKVEDGKLKVVEKSAEEKLLAQTIHANKVKEIEVAALKEIETIQKSHIDKIIAEQQRLNEAYVRDAELRRNQQLSDADKDANYAITGLNKQFLAGKLSAENLAKETEKIQAESAIRKLTIERDHQLEILASIDISGEERIAAEQRLSELSKAITDAEVAHKQGKYAELQEYLMKAIEVSSTVFNAIGDILDRAVDRRIENLEREKEKIDEVVAAQIAAVEASILSEEEKARKIAGINARATAEKEKISRKERQQEIDRARFKKSMTIFEILLQNALNIVQSFTDPIRLAAAIALGATQLAAAMSAPIPKFARGKKGKYQGLGIVGDGGRPEVIQRADGLIELTPNRDTLTYLGKDDIVHPSVEDFFKSIATPKPQMIQGEKEGFGVFGERIERALMQQTLVIANKRENHLSVKDGALVSVWKHGANQTRYFDQNTNW